MIASNATALQPPTSMGQPGVQLLTCPAVIRSAAPASSVKRTHRRAQLSSCGVAGDIRSQLQKPHNYRPRASLTAEAPQTSPQVDELAVQLKANQDSPIEHWLLQPSSISAQDVVLRLEPYLIGASELRGSASPAERRPVSGSASDLHAGLQRPARQSTASPTAATSPQLPVQQQPHEQVILQHNADEGGPLQHAMQLHHSTPARQPGGNTLPSASERISRKELASLIARATSLRQIQELHDRHQHMLDPLHVSAILSRLPKAEELHGLSRPHLPDAYHPLASALSSRFQQYASAGAYAPRQLSAFLWVVAKLSLWQPGGLCQGEAMSTACIAAQQMREHLSCTGVSAGAGTGGRSQSARRGQGSAKQRTHAQQQHRSNQQRAEGSHAGSTGGPGRGLQPQWVAQPSHQGRLHPQDVSNTAWAVAHLLMGLRSHLSNHYHGRSGEEADGPVLGDPMAAGEDGDPPAAVAGAFPVPLWPQVAGSAAAVSQLHSQLLLLMPALASAVPAVVPAMGAQEATNTLWAFAHFSRHLKRAAQLQQAQGELEEAHQAGRLADALATVSQAAERVVKRLGRVMRQMQEQHVACCIWALATLGLRDEPTLGQLCRRASQLVMGNFSAQGLSLLAWGLARLDYRDAGLLAALPAAAKSRARRFNGQGLSNLVWGLSHFGVRDQELLSLLAREAVVRVDDLSPLGLATLLSAWAHVRLYNISLFSTALPAASTQLPAFTPGTLVRLLDACARVGHSDPAAFEAAAQQLLPWVQAQQAQSPAQPASVGGSAPPAATQALNGAYQPAAQASRLVSTRRRRSGSNAGGQGQQPGSWGQGDPLHPGAALQLACAYGSRQAGGEGAGRLLLAALAPHLVQALKQQPGGSRPAPGWHEAVRVAVAYAQAGFTTSPSRAAAQDHIYSTTHSSAQPAELQLPPSTDHAALQGSHLVATGQRQHGDQQQIDAVIHELVSALAARLIPLHRAASIRSAAAAVWALISLGAQEAAAPACAALTSAILSGSTPGEQVRPTTASPHYQEVAPSTLLHRAPDMLQAGLTPRWAARLAWALLQVPPSTHTTTSAPQQGADDPACAPSNVQAAQVLALTLVESLDQLDPSDLALMASVASQLAQHAKQARSSLALSSPAGAAAATSAQGVQQQPGAQQQISMLRTLERLPEAVSAELHSRLHHLPPLTVLQLMQDLAHQGQLGEALASAGRQRLAQWLRDSCSHNGSVPDELPKSRARPSRTSSGSHGRQQRPTLHSLHATIPQQGNPASASIESQTSFGTRQNTVSTAPPRHTRGRHTASDSDVEHMAATPTHALHLLRGLHDIHCTDTNVAAAAGHCLLAHAHQPAHVPVLTEVQGMLACMAAEDTAAARGRLHALVVALSSRKQQLERRGRN